MHATVIIWSPAPGASADLLRRYSVIGVIGSGISFGHAALRTYSGGPIGRGEYLSFFGGSQGCACCYTNRSSAHFHTVGNDDEDCYGAAIRAGIIERKEVQLDGLDIDAVNLKIAEIKISKGKQWWPQQNCSDFVLEALRAGAPDFSSHVYQRPYGWKTGAFFSLASLPYLFILRDFLIGWYAYSVQASFAIEFLLDASNPVSFMVLSVLIGPLVFKGLLTSAMVTKRIPGMLNPTFSEINVAEQVKTSLVHLALQEISETEQKEIMNVIKMLFSSLVRDRKAQEFFANLVLSLEARNLRNTNNIIVGGVMINALLFGLSSGLYFWFSFKKIALPFRCKLKVVMQDAALVAFSSACLQISLFGTGLDRPLQVGKWTASFLLAIGRKSASMVSSIYMKLPALRSIPLPIKLSDFLSPYMTALSHYFKKAYYFSLVRLPVSVHASVIGVPLIALFIYVKYFLDISVTPNYVFNLAKKHQEKIAIEDAKPENKAESFVISRKSLLETTRLLLSRKSLFLAGATIATGALLFYDISKFRITTNSPPLALKS